MREAQRSGWKTVLWSVSDPDTLTSEQRKSFDEVIRFDEYEFETFARKASDADVVFIDEMYLPDSFYEQARAFVDRFKNAKLVAMDDMNQRSMESVHLVINPELGLRAAEYQSEKVLLGEEYCLLRSGFENPQKRDWPSKSSSVPVLVIVGGTDPHGSAFDALEALRGIEEKNFAPVLISGDGRNRESIQAELSHFDKFKFETGLNSRELADWIETCSFGVIGCGSTVYEFAAMKTPFVGLCVADNQQRTSERIEQAWKMPIVYRHANGISQDALERAIRSTLEQLEADAVFNFGNVDLLGAKRVIRYLDTLSL